MAFFFTEHFGKASFSCLEESNFQLSGLQRSFALELRSICDIYLGPCILLVCVFSSEHLTPFHGSVCVSKITRAISIERLDGTPQKEAGSNQTKI